MPEFLRAFPIAEENDFYQREIASMLRSDLVTTCSDYELIKLRKEFNIPNCELITFFYP